MTKDPAPETEAAFEIVESMGVKLPIDPTVVSPAVAESIRAGNYEKSEAKNLARIVEPGDRVLELGGGLGYLSAVISRMDRAEAIVVVEANPGLIPLIRITHGLNGASVLVVHAAVVADDDVQSLPFPVEADFWASGLAPRKGKIVQQIVEVPAISLSRLVAAHRPTMMIIDVEGSEAELLSRVEDLAGVHAVLIEVHEKVIGPAGVKRLFDFFSAAGFYVDVRLISTRVVVFRRLAKKRP